MILVAGLGNIFFGDDAFGSETARRLASRDLPDGVRVVDFGIRGLDFVFALLESYDAVIIIDTAARGYAPGTLFVIEPDLDDGVADCETHSIDPVRALAMAHRMGAVLRNVRIVGCEPETFGDPLEGCMGMSSSVNAAVDEAIPIIESLIQEVRV
jgi:hydrogenase maturation protease